jgi:hypothetical protein
MPRIGECGERRTNSILPRALAERLRTTEPQTNGHGEHGERGSRILEKYGERARAALEKYRHAPVFGLDGPAAADLRADLRAAAAVLAGLEHDTPERRALLKSLGLGADALAPRYLGGLAKAILAVADARHDEEVSASFDKLTWTRMPYPDREEGPPEPGLNTRRLSDVIATEVEWVWPGRVPKAKLTLLCGDPAVGKTWLALDLVARLTTGRPFPDAPNPFARKDGTQVGSEWPRRDALFVSAEDADDDTIKPRVETLRGDPSRVHTLRFVYDRATRRRGSLALDLHLEMLSSWLAEHPLVELVVLDPLSAFLGRVDSHRNSEVRGILGPLSKLAEKRRVAILGINHLNKGEGQALYRAMGSIGFNAAARAVWQVCKDKDDPGRSLFLPVKFNLGPSPSGLAFRLSPQGLLWEEGMIETTADEALNGPGRGKVDAAREFLRELLKAGPMPAAEVFAKAKAAGHKDKSLKTAKAELRVVSTKAGGTGKGWVWALPPTEVSGGKEEGPLPSSPPSTSSPPLPPSPSSGQEEEERREV